RESRTHGIFEVNDVQGRRALVEIVAIAAWIKAKERTKEQANRRFVRNDNHVLVTMRSDDLYQHRQSAGGHRQPAFSALWRKGVRILFPGGGFRGKSFFHLAASHLLPVPVRNLAQAFPPNDLQAVWPRDDAGRLDRPAYRRSLTRVHLFFVQAFSKPPRLFPAFVGKFYIRRPGKTILCG